MVRQIIVKKLNSTAGDFAKNESKEKIFEIFKLMGQNIKEIQSMELGSNKNPEDDTWDFVINLTFNTWEDLITYWKHPEHERTSMFVRALTDTVCRTDYEF